MPVFTSTQCPAGQCTSAVGEGKVAVCAIELANAKTQAVIRLNCFFDAKIVMNFFIMSALKLSTCQAFYRPTGSFIYNESHQDGRPSSLRDYPHFLG